MPQSIKIILNTHGGKPNGPAKTALVEQAVKAGGLDYHLEITQHPTHGVDLARQAKEEGWPVIVAAGGDGTINQVINGLMQVDRRDTEIALGIIPLGTGNDLADALSLPLDIKTAVQRIAAGETRLIDLGIVNGRYFANNSAVGLEPVVTTAYDDIGWVNGKPRYVLAALQGIVKNVTWDMRLVWDHGIYEGPITLVSVGNGSRTGGAFYMTPQAKLDDGLLDFVYAFGMSRFQMLRLLPKILSGRHIHHPLVCYLQTKSLCISAASATPIQADGEVIDETAVEISYQIAPEKLRVIV